MIELGKTGWIWGATVAAAGLLIGCDDDRQIEASVDARPGLSQPGAASGKLVGEAQACEDYESALSAAKKSLDCDEIEFAACPGLIRPGSSLACVEYTESSLKECIATVSDYKKCSDFTQKTCLLTAVTDSSSEGCVLPGPPDEPDAGADAGEATDSGAAGTSDAGKTPEPPPPLSDAAAAPMDASQHSDAAVGDAG